MTAKPSNDPETIPPADYPPVMTPAEAAEFLRALKSEDIEKRLAQVLASKRYEFADAVKLAAKRLEAAARGGDFAAVFAEAHEIRGLGATGGLAASGWIADRLCLYLHAVEVAGQAVDSGIVGLHVGAISRAAHAEDEATRLGSQVAEQLGALVARKLGPAAPKRFR